MACETHHFLNLRNTATTTGTKPKSARVELKALLGEDREKPGSLFQKLLEQEMTDTLSRGQVLVRFGPTIPVRLGFDLGSFSRCVRGTKLVFPDLRAFSWMGYFEFVDLNWAIQ